MFKRLLWAGVGAAAGILAVRKVKRTARRLTPSALGGRASGITAGARSFADDVREGMAKREFELHAALGLDVTGDVEDGGIGTNHDMRDGVRNAGSKLSALGLRRSHDFDARSHDVPSFGA